mgnify:CR=1 FL=1
MSCKFRIDFEDRLKILEEALKRDEFEEKKYDWIKNRKDSKYQFLLSSIRKCKTEIEFCKKKIEELSEIDSDPITCEELNKQYDEVMKGFTKKEDKVKSDKELAEDLFKELGF